MPSESTTNNMGTGNTAGSSANSGNTNTTSANSNTANSGLRRMTDAEVAQLTSSAEASLAKRRKKRPDAGESRKVG